MERHQVEEVLALVTEHLLENAATPQLAKVLNILSDELGGTL